jgi:non-ribosomal peptide synthetase component F
LPAVTFAASDVGSPIDNIITARCDVALPARLTEAAMRFSQQEGGTLFMTLMTALKMLLHRYTGQDDIRVATNVANRNRAATDTLIGPLVNTLVLRTDLAGDPSPREVMRRVRAASLAAFANQDLAFEQLIEILAEERARKPLPLANVMMLLQNATLRPLSCQGHKLGLEEASPDTLVPLVTITSFDIIMMLRQGPRGLSGTCVYKPHLFQVEAIDRLLHEFQDVLEYVTSNLDEPISAMRVG